MRRAAVQTLLPVGLACLLALCAGCGRGGRHGGGSQDLTFENLPDTSALASGAPLVEDFEVIRLANGTLQVHGRSRLPEGTRLRVGILEPGGRTTLAMTQASVHGSRFISPLLIGDTGPLPVARYRFELLARFTPDWQPPDVMRATDAGRMLRGPGITRTRLGEPTFYLEEELTR